MTAFAAPPPTRRIRGGVRTLPTGRAPSMRARPAPPLIFVTPPNICATPGRAAALAAAAVAGGATLVQLRDRRASRAALAETAAAIARALPSPRLLVVNGPAGAAVAAGVGGGVGVHLREADVAGLMEGALAAGGLVGVSVHSARAAVEAVRRGRGGLGYVQVGTMFETGSHPGKVPEGVALMRAVREAVGEDVVLVGVGGVEAATVGLVVGRGRADGVAVISAIADAADPRAAARALSHAVQQASLGAAGA
jgi:thiamine-phosphate diphosphorylase